MSIDLAPAARLAEQPHHREHDFLNPGALAVAVGETTQVQLTLQNHKNRADVITLVALGENFHVKPANISMPLQPGQVIITEKLRLTVVLHFLFQLHLFS